MTSTAVLAHFIKAPSIAPTTPVRDREWWRPESARMGSDWNGIMRAAALPLARFIRDGSDPFDNPGWATAAEEYHQERGGRTSIVDISPADVRRIKALLDPCVTLERAYWAIQNQPRPTSDCLVDSILHCVQCRDVPALQEPENVERLSRCDSAARTEIDIQISNMKAKSHATRSERPRPEQ